MQSYEDLAGLLDGALSAARTHQPDKACALMRELARRASSIPPSTIVEGPEELPASFYLNSAKAFLRIHCYSRIE